MTLIKMIFVTMILGVLTGLSMDFLPEANATHTALGLSTGASGASALVIFLIIIFGDN